MIRFKCPHCQKPLSVKDHLAGKKAACPACKKPIKIPAPVAAAADLEDFAASALADEPAPAAAAAKTDGAPAALPTIDFNCPYCDAELHLPGEDGGKQLPCPECKHIVKVPKLVVEKKDWRDVKPTGPTVAQMSQPKEELEGAWGTGVKAKVSRDALEEAGAVVEEDEAEPVGIGTWIKRGLVAAVVLAALYFGYTWWSQSQVAGRQLASLNKALELAPDDPEKGKLPPAWAAEVRRGAGEFFIRAKNPELALKHFANAMELAKASKEPVEADALLLDIAVTMVELGGSGEAVDNKERLAWPDVIRHVTQVFDRIQNAEAVQMARQEVGAKLRRLGQTDVVAGTPPESKSDGEANPPKVKQPDRWAAAVTAAASGDAKSHIDEAQKEWKNARSSRPAPFLVLQFIRASARADLTGTKELLKTLPPLDKHVKARANLECLLVHLEQATSPAEFNLAEEVGDKESAAYAIAWSAIARQKTRLGQRSEVLATQPPDEKLAAYLHLGAALGDQDRK